MNLITALASCEPDPNTVPGAIVTVAFLGAFLLVLWMFFG